MTLRLIIGLSPDSTRLIFLFLPTPGLTHTQICQTFDTNKQTIINGQAEPCRCNISIKLLVKCDTLIRYIESISFIKRGIWCHTHCLLQLWWSSLNWLDIPRLPRQEGPRRSHFAGKWWQYEGGIQAQCYACRLTTWNDYTSHTFPHQNCVNVVMPQFNTAASKSIQHPSPTSLELYFRL